jgi:hypothetical protein
MVLPGRQAGRPPTPSEIRTDDRGVNVMSDGNLTEEYFRTYTSSAGIGQEHGLDAAAVLRMMQGLPEFWGHLCELAATVHVIGSVDVGSGEGAKPLAKAAGIVGALGPYGLERFVLHANEPADQQLEELAKRVAALPAWLQETVVVNVLQQPFESLHEAVRTGAVRLDPRPTYATCMHVAYYLEQVDGRIPALAAIPDLLQDDGLLVLIIEGPGQLQAMKQHMKQHRGLPEPASQAMIMRTLRDAEIPHGDPPIVIPNFSWKVDKSKLPGDMFRDDMEFLLDGNYGSRPLEWEDLVEAGRWVQEHALPDGNGGWCLDGPDALIVAGPWLAQHPGDMAALEEMGRASVAASEVFRAGWPPVATGAPSLDGHAARAKP